MPRAIPKDWKSSSIEIFEIEALYDAKSKERLCKLFDVRSEEKRKLLLNKLFSVSGLLRLMLHHRHQPTEGERAAALDVLLRKLKRAQACLAELDDASRKEVEASARRLGSEAIYVAPVFEEGRARFRGAALALDELAGWVTDAKEQQGRSPAQPHTLTYERHSIAMIVKIWSEDKIFGSVPLPEGFERRLPSVSEVKEIADALLKPIASQFGEPPELTSIIREVLVDYRKFLVLD